MLVTLVSAQRTQSIHLLDLQFMKESTDQIEFVSPTHVKQSRSIGYPQGLPVRSKIMRCHTLECI